MIEPAATGEGVGGWAGRAVQVWLGEVLPLLFRALANYAAEALVNLYQPIGEEHRSRTVTPKTGGRAASRSALVVAPSGKGKWQWLTHWISSAALAG
jgi:hypothetical protein